MNYKKRRTDQAYATISMIHFFGDKKSAHVSCINFYVNFVVLENQKKPG